MYTIVDLIVFEQRVVTSLHPETTSGTKPRSSFWIRP
jgi:hypothetical protein